MEFKLIFKKLNDSLTEAEELMFREWYNESTNHKKYFDNVKNNYSKDIELVDLEKGWKSLTRKLDFKPKRKAYWKYIAAASIIVLLITIPFLLNEPDIKNTPVIVNEIIEPGTNKATLTLENGKVIALERGEQYTSDNLMSNGEELIYNISKDKEVEIAYNYLTVPRGGEFYVKLSDGTQVWLNSESQIKYPVAFIKGEPRQVELLYGEAYFDVSPSTNHKGTKFKVLTGIQNIEVLGTEFNVSAYKDEDAIYTTLVEGKINVNNASTNAILRPEQQSIIKTIENGIEVVKADVYSVTSWRKGVFSFDNMSLEKIMKVLSRWYNVDVVFVDSKLKEVHFTGVLRKNQNIKDILKSIKTINNITYDIKNNTVIFK